jgi:mitochondrial import receptor subunit TOM40
VLGSEIVSDMAAMNLEKDVVLDVPVSPPSIPSKSSYFNPISPLTDAFERITQWKTDLGLPHPGTVENLQKEVKCTFHRSPLV